MKYWLSLVGLASIPILLFLCFPDFPYLLFQWCCDIMRQGAQILGLTYKEFCVIGNIYLQSAVLVLLAVSVFLILLRKNVQKRTTKRIVGLALSSMYAGAHLVAFSLICFHYSLPLDRAFDLCVNELETFGKYCYNIGYIGANLVIFVFGWLALFVLDIALLRLAKKT